MKASRSFDQPGARVRLPLDAADVTTSVECSSRDTLEQMHKIRHHFLTALCVVIVHIAALPQSAGAQDRPDGWNVAVYPILAWVPLGIGIDVDVPSSGGDGGGRSTIVDSRLDGAYLGGATASNGTWRIEADGIWAGFGGNVAAIFRGLGRQMREARKVQSHVESLDVRQVNDAKGVFNARRRSRRSTQSNLEY